MRRMALAFACILPLSGPALGAAGDVLTVIGDRVNVRSGPSTDRDVRMQVSRNQRLLEIERQGDWVRAEIFGTGGADGWIHGSLVAPPNGEPLATQAPMPQPVERASTPAGVGETAAEPESPAGAAGPETEAIAPGAAPDIEPLELQRFRDSVAYLNSRSKLVAGVDLFTEVEPLGGGAVQVGATDAWADVPPAGQRNYANALLERWAAATGRADQITVQIVDQGGQVIMEESKP